MKGLERASAGGLPDDADSTLTQAPDDQPAGDHASGSRGAPADREKRERAAWERVPDRYRLSRTLGTGATAVVFEAHDMVLDRPVAVKVLDRVEAPGWLLREARFMAGLRHPNVVTVLDAQPSARIIVMELVEGANLEAEASAGPLAVERVLAIGRALASALATAHSNGVLHRDVKPSNVLLRPDGTALLADFGVAAAPHDDELVVGTRSYAAPEQLRGETSPESDVYGLGATLLRVATGARVSEVLARGESFGEHVLSRTRSRALARAVDSALSSDPRRRPSAAELGRLLTPDAGSAFARRAWPLAAFLTIAASLVAVSVWRDRVHDEALRGALDALARHDIDRAEQMLEDCDPRSADAAYAAALVSWWRGEPPPDVLQHVDHARALGLTGNRMELLDGVRLLVNDDIDDAVAHFRNVVRHRPAEGAARYGLFEALWHQGRGAEAIEVHRAIERDDPDFALGLEHVLTYLVFHRELPEVERILARSSAVSREQRTLWAGRVALARGSLAEGERMLRELAAAEAPSVAQSLAVRDLVELRLAQLDLAGAEVAAQRAPPADAAVAHYAIELSAGHPTRASRHRAIEILDALPNGGVVLTVALASMDLGGGRTSASDRVGPRRPRTRDARGRMLDLLEAHARGDRSAVRAARESTSPEVARAAEAILAEERGDLADALRLWGEARAASNDGAFEPYELHAAARLHRSLGHSEEVVTTCEELLSPARFRLATAPWVVPCLTWTAEAQDALGRSADAAGTRARLARLRGP